MHDIDESLHLAVALKNDVLLTLSLGIGDDYDYAFLIFLYYKIFKTLSRKYRRSHVLDIN